MKFKVLFSLTLAMCLCRIAFAQDAAPTPAGGRGYLVGPGDEITGKVLGESQFDFVATIDEDGKFQVPFFDQSLYAKCRTEKELRIDVTKLLSKYLKNPQISVRVTESKSRPPASIYGEVKIPQKVELRRKASLLELLSFAGGVTEEAGGIVQVFRTQKPMCAEDAEDSDWTAEKIEKTANSEEIALVPSKTFKLSNVKLGLEDSNPVIYPGDVIVVQRAAPIYVTGEVNYPQGILLKEGGTTLTEAIAKIGGMRREAKTKDIKIYRLKGNSKEREVIAANYDLIKKGKQEDPKLQPYDIIEVDKSKKSIAQVVLETAIGVGRTAAGTFGQAIPNRVLY